MKKCVIALLFLMTFGATNGQQLELQAGIRSGVASGLTVRLMDGPDTWTEGMLLNRNRGVQLYVLRGETRPFPGVCFPYLTLNMGWGAHVGNTSSRRYDWIEETERYNRVPVIGADFFLSAEYTLKVIPLSIALDYKPFAEIVPDRLMRINLWDFGCTIRYHFTSKI